MAQLKIFIPDDLEKKIKATGRPAEEIISELIRDYFQEHARSNAEVAQKTSWQRARRLRT